MKILIIGNFNSVFVKNFIRSIHTYSNDIRENITVDILESGGVSPNSDILKEFRSKGWIEEFFTGKLILPVGRNSKLWRLLKKLKNNGLVKLAKFLLLSRKMSNPIIDNINNNFIRKYDTILLQGFGGIEMSLFNQLRIENQHVVGAFWGSDFYRREKMGDSFLKKIINKCDRVIISTQQMQSDISAVFHIEKTKIRKALFGIQPLQNLYELRLVPQIISKSKIGLVDKNFVITCGYNATPDHQHIEILKALVSVKDVLPHRTKVIFPMTYGRELNYMEQVKIAIANSGIDCIVMEEFLTDEEVAHLRKATDFFIQIQATDANSGSFREHLAAQNLVLTGSWLPYKEYQSEGVFFETIDHISQLSKKIKEVLANFSELKTKAEKMNSFDKFKTSLWSECIKDWYNILNEYKNADEPKN